jgi:hypothetical protein
MKKLFTFLFAALTLSLQVAKANENADLFNIDRSSINAEFTQLNQLDQFVSANEGITLSEVQANRIDLLNDMNSPDSFQGLNAAFRGGEDPLGIPSFIWGCVLGWVGILIVYLISEDKELTKKALYGCLIGWGGGFVLYLLFWVVIIGSSGFWAI